MPLPFLLIGIAAGFAAELIKRSGRQRRRLPVSDDRPGRAAADPNRLRQPRIPDDDERHPMGTKTYEVMRDHGTNPPFKKGETRDLMEHEAQPLLASGTLRPAGGGNLVEEAKAERAAPLNKAETIASKTKTAQQRFSPLPDEDK